MKTPACITLCFLLFFACDDSSENPEVIEEKCQWEKLVTVDPDDPMSVKAEYNDEGKIIRFTGTDDIGDYTYTIEYDAATGLPKDSKQVAFEIKVDPATGKIIFFRLGDEAGAALRMVIEDDKISMTSVLGEDQAGVETEEYEYNNDGNVEHVTATGHDENGEETSTIEATFFYDMDHKALFHSVPFMQGLAAFDAYLLPFGLSNENLLKKVVLKTTIGDNETTESREFSYNFDSHGRVVLVSFTNSGGTFTANMEYLCD